MLLITTFQDGSGSFIYDGLRANDTNMNITIKVQSRSLAACNFQTHIRMNISSKSQSIFFMRGKVNSYDELSMSAY